MAQNLTSDVPWNMCHQLKNCAAVPNAKNRICTINGFWMDVGDKWKNQPSPYWIDYLKNNTNTPSIAWTEDQGWFGAWGTAKRVRSPSDIG